MTVYLTSNIFTLSCFSRDVGVSLPQHLFKCKLILLERALSELEIPLF